MGDPPALKRPKLEKDDHDSAYCSRPSASAAASGDDEDEEAMAEEAVVALVAHRKRDVERCKLKLLHYQSLLDSAEMKLAEAQARLDRYKDRKPPPPSQREPKPPPQPIQRDPKPSPPPEKKAPAPAPAPQPAGRPQLVIPGANNRPAPRPEPMSGLKKAAAPSSSSSPAPPPPERSRKEEKKPKRKTEEKEHQNLIPSVKKSSATVLKFQGGTLVSSQHRRKLRCLELCPSNDQLVVTRYGSQDIINTSKHAL